MKKLFLSLLLLLTLILPSSAFARSPSEITDWYIKDFTSEIIVNKDSSLDITEKILADCGNLPDKHGIFRVLPTVYYKTDMPTKAPIELIGIYDENGNPRKFTTTKDEYNMITWKIGDPNITVTGENFYEIKYRVKNTIRFDNESFDEFYWNLNGNFWDIETDHFLAKIILPPEISQANVKEVNLYSGNFGDKDSGLASYSWTDSNTIKVESKRTLRVDEGITLSLTFPKNIISPYVPTFWEKYGEIIMALSFLLLPLLVLVICFVLWWKYGRDVGPGRAVAPEFDIPDGMNPMEMNVFLNNGSLKSSAISAAIVNLAVKGFIKIEAIPKKGIFSSADTKLIKLGKPIDKLTDEEKNLLDYLFDSNNEIKVSDLKNEFYKHIPKLKDACFTKLSEQNLFEKKGFGLQSTMIVVAIFWFIALFFIPIISSVMMNAIPFFYAGSIISIIILVIFSFLMPKRSEKGADLLWRIKGFKMYMMTAEKYRQKFIEKEGLFEKFLPYAMLFGITGLWIAKMKEIYGEEYFNTYHPIWYVGYIGNFNIDNFNSQLSAIASSMASTMSSSPSSSGSGGGGFSGGGGGGGGGGGW